VPKTSSGKVRRSSAREVFESGRIGRGGAALGLQLAHLALTGLRSQAGRRLRSIGDLLYSAWGYGSVALLAVPIWLAVVLAPGLKLRRRVARLCARVLFAWIGMPLRLEGGENLRAGGPRIVAPNHQSYLDGLVLTALLPPDFAFVVKRELEKSLFARVFLRRLGTLFVERFDAAQSAGETRKVLEAIQAGQSLVIFPEGTFQRYPGLLPFRMGTFAVAVDAGVPVVPVAIQGTRSLLRGDDRLLRHGRVKVAAAPAVKPDGNGWHAGVRLRDEVRAAILARCGEPDLG
jgi:1-acyl-sn-glycerol-3-phosphate acyltransferase